MRVPAAIAMLSATVSPICAQATHISAADNDYLLTVTQQWGNRSPLGDMLRDSRDSTDVEIRLWAGYGITGTRGTVLRKSAGRWSAYYATVEQCLMPLKGDEHPTDKATADLEAQARKRCPPPASGRYVTVYWVTLRPAQFVTPPDTLFRRLVDAGLLRLPPQLHPGWSMLDGFTYVLELRQGDAYRASIAPQSETSRTDADLMMREIARLMSSGIKQPK